MTDDVYAKFIEHIDSRANDYDATHRVRYLETFSRINPYLEHGRNILELGGKSRIAEFFELNGCDVSEYTKDLRFRFDLADNFCDYVFLLEVYEHIKDREPDSEDIGSIATFTYSGIYNLLSEIKRVTKPHGLVFVTTPNATSVDALIRVLRKMPPFGFTPHVREYAPCEVRGRFEEHGFSQLEFSTFFAWNALDGIDREAYIKRIGELGGEQSDRGDDMFFIFKNNKEIGE